VTAIFIVFMGVYFVLTIATLAEIKRIPPEFDIVAANLGANRWHRWLHVEIPAILPGVFLLLRTNFIAAWMSVLVAEMVGLRDGLGAIIMMGRNLFNNDLIMFGMVIIGLSGFLVDAFLRFIGKRILWWRI
jgi:NitT/TauT family transport system permease protein